jgi:hypothetical protein
MISWYKVPVAAAVFAAGMTAAGSANALYWPGGYWHSGHRHYGPVLLYSEDACPYGFGYGYGPPVYLAYPVYGARCSPVPVYDSWGNFAGYTTACW